MRNLLFGFFIYLFIVSIIYPIHMNFYASWAGILSASALFGIGLGNALGEIALREQERDR